jgi:hypothetical protein
VKAGHPSDDELTDAFQACVNFTSKSEWIPKDIDPAKLVGLVDRLSEKILTIYFNQFYQTTTIHAQGFIRFNVTDVEMWNAGDGIRLHIWHGDIARPFSTPFDRHHRHSFSSDSIVLSGKQVTDHLYHAEIPSKTDESIVRVYKTRHNDIVADRRVILKKDLSRTAEVGQGLHYPRKLFHLHDLNDPPIITLFRKYDFDHENPAAETVGPVDLSGPLNRFNPRATTPDQSNMWSFILSSVLHLDTKYLDKKRSEKIRKAIELRNLKLHQF